MSDSNLGFVANQCRKMEEVSLRYRVFLNGEYSPWRIFDFLLRDDEKMIYEQTLDKGRSLNSERKLAIILKRAQEVLAPEVVMEGINVEDTFILQCYGMVEVEAAYINELIAERNQEALEFFGLENAPDEALNSWNAEDLAELPFVCELGIDFQERNPFDYGIMEIEFVES